MSKKVLIISYYWPPSGGAGVQRWLKFVKYLPEFGWQPVVYTPENPEPPSIDESLLNDIPDSVEVVKKPIWEPYTFYKTFTGKNKSEKVNAGFIQEKESNTLLEKVSVFVRGNFFIPDARKFWVKPSVKFLENYLVNNKIDAVITTGPPHSMHLIGLQLKQKLNIKWLADFRDPWTNIDYYNDLMLTHRSDRKHKKLENTVLKNADRVLTVGNTLAEELKQLGGGNINVITNGYDSADIANSSPELDEKFSILHAGSLNKDRNHPVLWEVLAALVNENPDFKLKLEIRLIGKVDVQAVEMIKSSGLEEHLNKTAYVPHNEIVKHQQSARLLYLPINNTPNAKGILTGKFFEYLAAGRPILTIGPKDGDIAEIVHETKSGKVFAYDDFDGLKAYINTEFVNFKNNKEYKSSQDIERYSRKALAKCLSEVLNEV